MGGLLCCNEETRKKIFNQELMTLGGIMSPFNAWLIMRGMRTLPMRMDRVAKSGLEIAGRLSAHEKVEEVFYPFLPSHPQHKLALKQFKQGAGQFTLALKTHDFNQVEAFCNSLEKISLACSWGGYESLAFPAMALNTSLNYSPTSLGPNLIRFYIGLEDVDYLWRDLESALSQIN
jgi:cystathionine beta-lyase/cystathionine gamma-synthase